jgi:arsenate reductase-like glutaredoxin family protein
LDEATKTSINDTTTAIALMQAKTSVIKRPILEKDKQILALGFSENDYQHLFTQ